MQKHIIDGVEVWHGSGNVFADLELPGAEGLKAKTALLVEIRRKARALGLAPQEAAARMGVAPQAYAGMMRGDFDDVSVDTLMDCLERLGCDVEIRVRPSAGAVGRRWVAVAA